MQRVKGPDHRQTRVIMIHLAAVYRRVGRPDEALPLAEKGFALTETKMGPGHPDTLWAMWNLAKTYAAVSRLDEALELHSERVNRLTTTLGPNHPKTLRAMKSLADAYAAGSRVDDALALYEETLKRMTATLGPDHSNTIAALRGLAEKYARHGRPDKAANAYARLLQNRPDDHGAALRAAFHCLAANDQAGYEAVCRGMLDRFADIDDAWAVNRTSLACLTSSAPVGDIEQLVRLADLAVAAYHDGTGLASRVIGYRTRGLAAYRAGDFQSALDWCRRSRDLESTRTDSSSYLATALVIEAMALSRQGKPAEALAAYNESVEMIQRHFPNAPVDLGAYWFNWLMHEVLRREAAQLLNLAAADSE